MKNSHENHHSCSHCACHNPILDILKDKLFSEENFAALPTMRLDPQQKPAINLMVSGGTIRPMINGSVETVPAIGFANGQVAVTGTEAEVQSFMQQNHPGYTAKVLVSGQTLLPGLIEPHVHIVPTALLMGWLDLGRFQGQDLESEYNTDTLSDSLLNNVPNVKVGEWLLGFGLDPALMPIDNGELVTINADLLNSITMSVPVMILSASMHTLYLNTPALQAVYNNENNAPLRATYTTFEIYLDKTRGQLQDAAMGPALKCIPEPQIRTMLLESFSHLKAIFQTANERGVTFMYDAGMNNHLKALLDAYLLLHSRAVRIGAAQICNSTTDAQALPIYEAPTEYKDVYIGNIKVVSDGSNQGLTGYQSEAYQCNPPDNFGLFNFGTDKRPLEAPQDYQDLIQTIIVDKKWPLMVHANGDLAVQFAIQVYQQFIPQQSVQNMRHRIEHCSLIDQAGLSTMKTLGVSPSFLIGHVGYWGYAFNEAIFKGKTNMLDLCNSALQTGMRITLHSDNQVSPLGPLRMMEQSITRIMEGDPNLNTANLQNSVLNAEECITAEQALVAITYDAAWQCNADQWTGSLVAGNFADFVILAQDPLTLASPFMNMRNIGVLETWVDGQQVYPKP